MKIFLIMALLVAVAIPSALAATWNGTTNGIWSTATNWNPAVSPGSGGTATFDNAGSANTTLNLGAAVTVKFITFDTASAAAYIIGSGAVGSQNLALNQAAVITVNSTVVANETFNANILIGTDAAYSYAGFVNNSTTNHLIVAGGISGNTGGVAAGKELTFNGPGTTIVSGAISDGGATSLMLTIYNGKTVLSGTNTYTGPTQVNSGGGTVQFATAASLYGGNTASWTAANLTVNNIATVAFNVGGAGEFTSGNVSTLLTNLPTGTGGLKAGSHIAFDTTNAIGGNFTITDAIASGAAQANFGVTKLGSNTLTLSGTNSYLGGTTVSAGTLLATTSGAIPYLWLAGKVIVNGGTLGVQVGGSGWTTANVDTLLVNATKTSGAL